MIDQPKHGVHALRMSSDAPRSNGAHLLIAALARNLKARLAIVAPQSPQTRAVRRMESRRFPHAVMPIPAQVVMTGRSVVVRLLAWSASAALRLDGLAFFKRAARVARVSAANDRRRLRPRGPVRPTRATYPQTDGRPQRAATFFPQTTAASAGCSCRGR